MSWDLGFEIGEKVRFVCKGKGSVSEMRNRRSTHIRVVGLDISEHRSIKVNYFFPGSGECYEWFASDELEKLTVLDRIVEAVK